MTTGGRLGGRTRPSPLVIPWPWVRPEPLVMPASGVMPVVPVRPEPLVMPSRDVSTALLVAPEPLNRAMRTSCTGSRIMPVPFTMPQPLVRPRPFTKSAPVVRDRLSPSLGPLVSPDPLDATSGGGAEAARTTLNLRGRPSGVRPLRSDAVMPAFISRWLDLDEVSLVGVAFLRLRSHPALGEER